MKLNHRKAEILRYAQDDTSGVISAKDVILSAAKNLLKLTALTFPLIASAQIYQNGNNYSDNYSKGAAVIKPQEIETLSTPNTKNTLSNINTVSTKETTQPQISLQGVTDQETIQHGAPISIKIVTKNISTDTTLQLLLDGKTYPLNSDGTAILQSLERGEHTLQAQLMSAQQQLLAETQKVIITVHQNSELFTENQMGQGN